MGTRSKANYQFGNPDGNMNFPPFGSHFAGSIPSIHQFAAKFSHEGINGSSTQNMNDTQRYHGNQTSAHFNQGLGMVSQSSQVPSINTLKYNNHNINTSTQYAVYSSQQQDLPCEPSKQVKREDDSAMPASWQSLATPGSTVADYLSHLPASTLPLSLHHFLKYSAESIKKESDGSAVSGVNGDNSLPHVQQTPSLLPPAKKKKKKKPKEKKPRPKPGEIRLTTALDGSTLYCCPECHMAYPEKDMLEQHLLGHTLERRFVCDICGAGLKRKDHLTRHKQSHNPERPFVCTVCLKAFKRKEQLTLHFVIHSGDKRHVCPECGKGFYRKDHLRKHTRSHIARRVKAELSQHAPQASPPMLS